MVFDTGISSLVFMISLPVPKINRITEQVNKQGAPKSAPFSDQPIA